MRGDAAGQLARRASRNPLVATIAERYHLRQGRWAPIADLQVMTVAEIDLGKHFDRFVREQIETGRYSSATDVVQAGLGLLEEEASFEQQRDPALRRLIDEAFADNRPSIRAEEVFAELRAHHDAQTRRERDGG